MEIKIGTPSQYSKTKLVSADPPDSISKGGYYLSLYRGKELVGSLYVTKWESSYVLRKVEVKEEERGKGYGLQIMKAILDFLKPKGLSILLYVDAANQPAVMLYKKLGFEKIKSKTRFGDKYQLK